MRCCPNRQPKSAPEQNRTTRKLATSKLANWILCVCHVATLFLVMFIKSIWIGFIGVTLFVASASAASSVLQGIVKDAKGHPIQGADIRIEATNTGRLLTTVKTDVNGRYSLEGLAAGNYRMTLVVNGAVKASINNTTLEPGESTQLNFELKQTRASVTVTKGKHWVWIPAFTGSRLPGRWVEVDDSGGWAAAATANNIVRVSAEEIQREIHSRQPGR
jgi:5-hydroxyisourate hydrolase-like protein (transthyretin family)